MLKKIITFIVTTIKITLITFFISLILDFFFGSYILKRLDSFLSKTEFYERLVRLDHPIYHHTLKANTVYKLNKGFDGYFTLCTDNHGFKSKCELTRGKEFDYVFIGDSFTEGASVNYEDSFVGIFENEIDKSVANLGVVSYAPYIYLSKINYLLSQNYSFKEVIAVIDISDLYDDNVFYTFNKNSLAVGEKYAVEKNLRMRKILRSWFPLTNFYFFVIKKFDQAELVSDRIENPELKFQDKANLKASWTYSNTDTIEGYDGSIKKAQEELLDTMGQLYDLLQKNNIELSIVVYPWPQQLQFDKVNSKHAAMWQEFCKNRCKKYINLFPIFFDKLKQSNFLDVYKEYYWWNDVHFNKEGNKLVADELLKVFN